MQLHPWVKDRISDVASVTIRTHEAAIRIIDKKGPLHGPADRDHCMQYIVAVSLIFGRLTATDYEDAIACDPRIDTLREKMLCLEEPRFTRDYHDHRCISLSPWRQAQASARRRHATAGGEIQGQPGRLLYGSTAKGDHRYLPRSGETGSHARQSFRGYVCSLMDSGQGTGVMQNLPEEGVEFVPILTGRKLVPAPFPGFCRTGFRFRKFLRRPEATA